MYLGLRQEEVWVLRTETQKIIYIEGRVRLNLVRHFEPLPFIGLLASLLILGFVINDLQTKSISPEVNLRRRMNQRTIEVSDRLQIFFDSLLGA